MKRIVVFLAMALMAFSVAQAESEQDSTFVFRYRNRRAGAHPLAHTRVHADSGRFR